MTAAVGGDGTLTPLPLPAQPICALGTLLTDGRVRSPPNRRWVLPQQAGGRHAEPHQAGFEPGRLAPAPHLLVRIEADLALLVNHLHQGLAPSACSQAAGAAGLVLRAA